MGYGGIFGQKTIVDAFTKEQTLSNSTAALYGLGTDAVPDDVLAWLGKYNQYWWRRKLIPTEESWYETRESVSDHEISYAGTPSRENTVYYSNSINISQTDGTISLSDPNSLTFSYDDYSNIVPAIRGKYIYAGINLTIVFVPQTAEVYSTTSGGGFRVKIRQCYKIVSVHGVPPTEMPWQYVQSSDRSAYPDSGTQDGYEYEYLGIPFDNAVGAPKIETGSYTGTGTYGASNPNSLTFGFEPKLVVITGNGVGEIGILQCSAGARFGGYMDTKLVNSATLSISVSGNSVSWYSYAPYQNGTAVSNAAAYQLNTRSSYAYTYLAIG